MPYKIVRRGAGKAEVVTIATGKGHGVTTTAKAEAQLRLLRAKEHGMKTRRRRR